MLFLFHFILYIHGFDKLEVSLKMKFLSIICNSILLDQIQRLSGHAADPKFLSYITWLTYNHSPAIQKIDTVRAFHFGTSYLVEVDIVLPENMVLREVHDIGESLQKKIENLPDVERVCLKIFF